MLYSYMYLDMFVNQTEKLKTEKTSDLRLLAMF